MRNGGYSIIDLSVTDNLYTNAVKAVNTEKPILVYGDDVPYFADSVTADDDAVTITKGGQIVSISSANAITKTGDKDGALLSSIVDDDGNARFVDGDITTSEVEGVTFDYSKWSLSGTHLMIVLGGTVEDATTLASATVWGSVTLDSYILDKITALYSTVVDRKTFTAYASDGSTADTINMRISLTSTGLEIIKTGSTTTVAEGTFRIQFDLLIDTD